MQYPLQLTFKIWTFSPQITVTDAGGNVVFFVKQKSFKLKEQITIFSDIQRTHPLYYIKADRIIDFSARYNFSDANGMSIGAVKRRGLKSIWKAHYDIFDGDATNFHIQEKNPWVKVADALFAEIPIVGLFTGYVFNPTYYVTGGDGSVVMRLEKIPTFFSRKFTIKVVDKLSDRQEKQALLSLMMMILLERKRG